MAYMNKTAAVLKTDYLDLVRSLRASGNDGSTLLVSAGRIYRQMEDIEKKLGLLGYAPPDLSRLPVPKRARSL